MSRSSSPALRAFNTTDTSLPQLNLAALGKGLLTALLLLILGSLALSAAYCFTSLATPTAHLLQFAVLAAAALGGGLMAAKSAGVKGLRHGILLALALGLLMLLFSLSNGGIIAAPLLLKALVLLLAGAIGGILGVL